MKRFEWDEEKNEWLKRERGVSFQEVEKIIDKKQTLDVIDNPNKTRYPRQRLFIVSINNYAYVVPFVEDEEKVFLKTVIPSRKMTKKYLKRKEEENEKV